MSGGLESPSRTVRGKVAIVTGAASGIGRAITDLLASDGATVAAIDRDEVRLDEVVTRIRADGYGAHPYPADLAETATLAGLAAEISAELGPVDILINNAGICIDTPASLSDEDFATAWQRTIAVNLTAQVMLIRALRSQLSRDRGGRVVNLSSTEGLMATAGLAAYTAAKHGVIGMTRSLAVELGATGITLNAVCPGPIHTGLTDNIPTDAKTKFARRRVPLRRYGDPAEVAHMIWALVLPGASYVNGAVIVVDGGMTAQGT